MKRIITAVMIISMIICLSVSAIAAGEADPYYFQQRNLARIGYSAAWEQDLDGRGVRIALIDSGIYADHEEIIGANVLQGINVIDRSARVYDTSGHGTFIASMLAASRGNGIGISGMVDKSIIVPFKCFSTGEQSKPRYISSSVYMAVDEYDCDVINLSLGIGSDVPDLRKAIEYAVGKGVIVVAAVGNSGGTANVYPASYDNVVGVGSVDNADKSSYFSQRNRSVFVVAPGENLIGAGIDKTDSYMVGSGTSFSTAHVTALAAIAKQFYPSINAEQFMSLLQDSSEDLGNPGYDTSYGWGLVNVPEFVKLLIQRHREFIDIAGHWAEADMKSAAYMGLFSGVSDDMFAPDSYMTRAMAATTLYRLAGAPEVTGGSIFSDVAEGQWYTSAIIWASNNGIITGVGDGRFLPDNNITRQELTAIIYRYAVLIGKGGGLAEQVEFTDGASIAPWAQDTVMWCSSKGIITGLPDGSFSPWTNASRAEVATVLMRLYNYTES